MDSPAQPSAAKDDWWLALSSGVLLWASFPPLGLWPLAWVALIPWMILIRRKRLGFRRPYVALTVVGYVTWLALIQWVRLPHWSAYFGWLALCAYLSIYIALFVGISRIAVHSLGIKLWLAAPVAWCGLEALRAWLFSGFAVMLLGHSQANVPILIQISDVGGPHAVSFVIVLFSALLLNVWPPDSAANNPPRRRWTRLLLPFGLLLLVVGYGATRLVQHRILNANAGEIRQPDATVILVQGSVDTTFDANDDPEQSFQQYLNLSRHCVGNGLKAEQLVIWPESMFSGGLPHYTTEATVSKPDSIKMSDAEFHEVIKNQEAAFHEKTKWVASQLGAPLLVGTETIHWSENGPQQYNSALWIDTAGKIAGRYDKMHPVMFGEYVPFGDWLPVLYQLTPMRGGLTPGDGPQVIRVGNANLSPNICFENTVPHLIRGHIRELESSGATVDALVTITNDGWFWGSNALDAHFACGIFRAVENRCPLLIAANTGFSAHVDETGTVLQKGPRRACDVLFVDLHRNPMLSVYNRLGDWLGQICCICCLVVVVLGWRRRRDQPE